MLQEILPHVHGGVEIRISLMPLWANKIGSAVEIGSRAVIFVVLLHRLSAGVTPTGNVFGTGGGGYDSFALYLV